MRQAFMLLCIALMILSSSCKKTYTCQCLDKNTGTGTRSFTVQEHNEVDADAACGAESTSEDTCIVSH